MQDSISGIQGRAELEKRCHKFRFCVSRSANRVAWRPSPDVYSDADSNSAPSQGPFVSAVGVLRDKARNTYRSRSV